MAETYRDAPMREQHVSAEQFDTLSRRLMRLECEGHGPDACIIGACKAAGIDPPRPFEGVNLIVDPALSLTNGDR